MKRLLLSIAALSLVSPAFAIDLQSTTAPGRTVPSLSNGEIAINRADRTLFFKNVDGTIGRGSLMDATAAGRAAVEQGNASLLSVVPSTSASEGTLARALGDLSGFKAPGASGFARLDASFFTANARSFFNSPASGNPVNWLGNRGDIAGPNNYGYGDLAQIVALSGIGEPAITAAVRTEDIASPNRFPASGNFQAFNFSTTFQQTAWAVYGECRRKNGAGQCHGFEVNVTDLGNGSDRIIPSAMSSGPNAVYGGWTSGVNVACGGNVTTRTLPDGTVVQQQFGWDGTKSVTQASNCGVAIPIYANGAKFEKGIIIGDTALVGCDGTGGTKTCTGVEMGRGTDIGWIDGSTRIASLIRSDLSPSGNGLRLRFTDFGAILDGYGGATLNVIAKASDVNGVQVIGGGSAAAPARIVAAGSPNASLGISASGGGVVQMQSVMRLPTYTVATLPVCDATHEGGMAYVTDSAAVNYRNAVNNGGGNLKAPVFCTGVSWEYH